jgi:hypothetical protein
MCMSHDVTRGGWQVDADEYLLGSRLGVPPCGLMRRRLSRLRILGSSACTLLILC